jgi:hypothetical protein
MMCATLRTFIATVLSFPSLRAVLDGPLCPFLLASSFPDARPCILPEQFPSLTLSPVLPCSPLSPLTASPPPSLIAHGEGGTHHPSPTPTGAVVALVPHICVVLILTFSTTVFRGTVCQSATTHLPSLSRDARFCAIMMGGSHLTLSPVAVRGHTPPLSLASHKPTHGCTFHSVHLHLIPLRLHCCCRDPQPRSPRHGVGRIGLGGITILILLPSGPRGAAGRLFRAAYRAEHISDAAVIAARTPCAIAVRNLASDSLSGASPAAASAIITVPRTPKISGAVLMCLMGVTPPTAPPRDVARL